jgi:hypothetical protein
MFDLGLNKHASLLHRGKKDYSAVEAEVESKIDDQSFQNFSYFFSLIKTKLSVQGPVL